MEFCYQVATPDIAVSPAVTAFQGDLNYSFERIADFGYDGVELMTLYPDELDWKYVKDAALNNGLSVVLVCTGEVYGQLGVSFTDPNESIRTEAISRVKKIIDFADYLGANINIGRVRGQYYQDIERIRTRDWALDAFYEISRYAAYSGVMVALESVTVLQTNFINTIAEACEMVDTIGCSNFKIMMDLFHMWIEEKDIYQTIKKYMDYCIHVHLADNNRRYPGQCGMDFHKILRTFKECGYDGAFSTEIYQIPDQEQAAKGAINHLKPIFADVYGRKGV